MRNYYIYTLSDPMTDEVRYIGQTVDPYGRLMRHFNSSKKDKLRSCRWINTIIRTGGRPIMRIIDSTTDFMLADLLEIQYILMAKELGFRLTNIDNGGQNKLGAGRSRSVRRKHRLNADKQMLSSPLDKAILQYTIEGKFVREHHSGSSAARLVGVGRSTLLGAVGGGKRGHEISGGYRWKYKTDDYPLDIGPIIRNPHPLNVPILQYGLDGVFIREYPTAEAAAKCVKCGPTIITRAAKLARLTHTARGFQWRLKTKDYPEFIGKVEKFSNEVRHGKPVEQYTISGEKINEYTSVANAKRTTNIHNIERSIRLSLTAGGYKWKYKTL